ncbi:MAG: M6 family metalloprotease domain-containing protein [Paludibacter sp.]|nr:M6 family metalloprotease domain-containing protein [Paludibacter sp.]
MSIKIILFVFFSFLLQSLPLPVFAVKAFPDPITVKQPDGTLLTVVLNGDEFHHYKTTEDGYVLKENLKGVYYYAKLNANLKLVGSNVLAKNPNQRSLDDYRFFKSIDRKNILTNIQSDRMKSKMLVSPELPQKTFQLNGTPKSLVILVNYKDTNFVVPTAQAAFTNLLNEDGYSANGGTGSARDYFMASSYGKFAPDFDVVGPFNLPNPMSYYGGNDASGNDLHPVQMIIDACTAANSTVDFSQYDTDNDGKIDNVFVYYAGYNEAEWGPENSIWPHRWQVLKNFNYFGRTSSITFDGKLLRDYACTSELKGNSGTNMCGIGTFCHEFGHILGLVDLYNTDDQSKPTLGSWSIMSNGNYLNNSNTPPTYSTWDRFYLGWLTPEEVNSASNLTILPIYQGKTEPENTNNQSYLLSATTHNLVGGHPNPSEFFLLEYRKKTGWDTYLPAEGMCIWHIDYDPNVWNNNEPNNYTETTQTLNSHMRVYLVPPTGVGTTPPAVAFTDGNFIPSTWAGENIYRMLTLISSTSNNTTLKISPSYDITGSFSNFSADASASSVIQTIKLTGGAFSTNFDIALTDKINFDIKLLSSSNWGKSITIPQSTSNINDSVQVRYNPQSEGVHSDQLIFSADDVVNQAFELNGFAIIPKTPVNSKINIGIVENLLKFSSTRINVTNTKTINIKTTDLISSLMLEISGVNASNFSVSTGSISNQSANSAEGYNVTINYSPVTLGTHTATLTISGGGLNPAKVMNFIGEGI